MGMLLVWRTSSPNVLSFMKIWISGISIMENFSRFWCRYVRLCGIISKLGNAQICSWVPSAYFVRFFSKPTCIYALCPTQAYYYCIFVSLPQIFKHCFTLCRLFPLYWANGRDRQFYIPSTQFHILILNLFINFIHSFIAGWKHLYTPPFSLWDLSK